MMARASRSRTRTSLALVLMVVLALQASVNSLPATAAPARLSYRNHVLGVALDLPAGWTITRWEKGVGLGFNVDQPALSHDQTRLSISAMGTTKIRNEQRAAAVFAQRLLSQLKGAHIRQVFVRYGGAPGIKLLGAPGARPTVQIVLAHHRVVYRIVAVGKTLAKDQKVILRTISFVPIKKSSPLHRT